jgi:Na+/proline symporter
MGHLDVVVLVIYLVGTLIVGVYFAGRNKTSADMFSAGGQSPWWVAGLSGFMTMKSAGTFVVWGGLAYRQGVVAISITTCLGLSALLVGKLVAGQWRKCGVATPAEFVEIRFGKLAVHLYTWSMMLIRVVSTGVALYSVSIMLIALIPLPEGNPLRDPLTGHLALVYAVLLFGIIVTIYTVVGGLWAVLMTDVLQFIILQISVIFVVFLLLLKVCAGAPIQPLPAHFFSPITSDFSLLFLIGWVCVHFFIIGAEWAFAQRYISVRSEKDARWSAYLFGALYLINPTLWLLPTLLFRLLVDGANPEQAYVLASQYVLPAGMLGLMIAAMFSATASAISGQINVFAGVLTEQFFRRRFRPDATESVVVMAGRWFTFLLGAALIVVALFVPIMGGAEKIIVATTGLLFGPLMAPTIWGLLSGRIGIKTVLVTALTSLTATIFIKFLLPLATNMGLEPLATWIIANPHLSEVIVGAGLPIIILSVAQIINREESAGWLEIKSRMVNYAPSPVNEDSTPHSPATVIYLSLGASGILMLLLTLLNSTNRTALFIFSVLLIVLALSVYGFTRRASKRP